MHIRIFHQTTYSYDEAPAYAVQRLHLTPRDLTSQKVLSWRVSAPGIERALQYQDGFGNIVHLVTHERQAGPSQVTAEGAIETRDTSGVIKTVHGGLPDAVFLRQTAATNPSAAMTQFLAKNDRPHAPLLERLHGLMEAVHRHIIFETGQSDAHTTAADAFVAGRGVCQDHAHVLIGLARMAAIPCRYVTGYLVTGTGAASAAAHAWAEMLVADLGWVGLDAANNQSPTELYVRVAAGLDAAAVTPVRGSRRGGSGVEQMKVEVRVEIAQQ